jgi:hypothetical protein
MGMGDLVMGTGDRVMGAGDRAMGGAGERGVAYGSKWFWCGLTNGSGDGPLLLPPLPPPPPPPKRPPPYPIGGEGEGALDPARAWPWPPCRMGECCGAGETPRERATDWNEFSRGRGEGCGSR